MFYTPEILTMPVFSAMGSGAVPEPSVGVVLAWVLVAAFVGSVLGLLREAMRGNKTNRVENAEPSRAAAEIHIAPEVRAGDYRDAA